MVEPVVFFSASLAQNWFLLQRPSSGRPQVLQIARERQSTTVLFNRIIEPPGNAFDKTRHQQVGADFAASRHVSGFSLQADDRFSAHSQNGRNFGWRVPSFGILAMRFDHLQFRPAREHVAACQPTYLLPAHVVDFAQQCSEDDIQAFNPAACRQPRSCFIRSRLIGLKSTAFHLHDREPSWSVATQPEYVYGHNQTPHT